jgi:hypothetical protein
LALRTRRSVSAPPFGMKHCTRPGHRSLVFFSLTSTNLS